MALPFPVDPGSNSNPNPYFQDNAFVRGDQQRSFSAQAWANMLNLDARLDVVEGDIVTIDGHLTTIDAEIAALQIATLATGLNTGGVVLNSTSLPPSSPLSPHAGRSLPRSLTESN